jgi:hypothetical protein
MGASAFISTKLFIYVAGQVLIKEPPQSEPLLAGSAVHMLLNLIFDR